MVSKSRGTTLVELVVAVAIMVVITSTLLSVLAPTRRTLDAQTNNMEVMQSGRVLMATLIRELSEAKMITAVSAAGEEDGYIEFLNNDADSIRFEINATNNYVQYGQVGDLQDLAGPVSQLEFTCFDPCDLDTSITDVNEIRLIKIQTTFSPASGGGQDTVFSSSAFVWRDGNATTDLEGWWCLDDGSGTTALDSSGNSRHGTLHNMGGDEWTTGVLDGALEFNGSLDYVDLPIGSVIESMTDCTVALWVKWSGQGDTYQRVFDFGSGTSAFMCLMASGGTGNPRFCIADYSSGSSDNVLGPNVLTPDWHHMAVTIDDANTTLTLYIDGEVAGQNISAQNNPSDLGETTQNWLGRSQYYWDPYFDGILDDVRLYSRALSAQEISDLVSNTPMVIYKDFTEAKTNAAQSLTIPTPGGSASAGDPVAMIGENTGLTFPTSFPFPAGSNRLLVFTAHVEDYDQDISLSAVTYGGQAMTKINEEFINEGGVRAYVAAYMINESGINSAIGNTFSPTWSGTPDYVGYYSFAVANVNQGSPIGDTDSQEELSDKYIWATLATDDGDMAILAATAGNKGAFTCYGGFTKAEEFVITPAYQTAEGVVGYRSADGSTLYPEVYHNSPNRQVLIGFVLQKSSDYAPVTTIEGDLLIAVVSVDENEDVVGENETLEPPSEGGWTLLSQGTGNDKVTVGVWAKLAAASEQGAHTFSWNSDEEAYGWIMRFEGFDPSSPLDVMASQGGGASWYPPSPSVTTSVTNTMILRIGGFDKSAITLDDTGISGYTTITMDASSGGRGASSGGAAYKYQLEIGSSGSATFDLTDDQEYRTVTIAIAPEQ